MVLWGFKLHFELLVGCFGSDCAALEGYPSTVVKSFPVLNRLLQVSCLLPTLVKASPCSLRSPICCPPLLFVAMVLWGF
ncbi:hypothetical protein BDR26DRAFT_852634 [Obelidium mucronatum]|nr:hypothetical protein BDR26DRAFT_852634 [Obelidium mucronatum]